MTATSDILMPKLGLTMTEGLLAEWLVKPGDIVKAGQILFVVETDKLSTEVEAPSAGEILEVLAQPGVTLPVGTTVARWTGEGSAGLDLAEPATATASPATSVEPEPAVATPASISVSPPASAPASRRVVATPLAKRLARRDGLDIGEIKGSGFGGRIKAADVKSAIDTAAAKIETPSSPDVASTPLASASGASTRVAPTPLQATVARRLTASKREIPHFYLSSDADVGALLALRGQLNGDAAQTKLSVNHFILAAVARTWSDQPEVNRVWEDDGFTQFSSVDLGMAVDTPRGLFAPVVRDAGSRGLDSLAREADALARRARDGRLTGDDLAGGAVSVSNVGMYDVTYLTPVINPGQSAILGVGTIRSVFRPDDRDQPVLKREIGLVLACDHRVLNGVTAAKLLASIVAYLESPLKLLRQPISKGE